MPVTDPSDDPKTCPVEMGDGAPCGRPLLSKRPGVVFQPACLMHSPDPEKDPKAFRNEIERILSGTSADHRPRDRLDFTDFVFPEADFRGLTFTKPVSFWSVHFSGRANFQGTVFTDDAVFGEARFYDEANFSGATFSKKVTFRHATFFERVIFNDGIFKESCDFVLARFNRGASFGSTTFKAAEFWDVIFEEGAAFYHSTFAGLARFGEAEFCRGASFEGTRFEGGAIFDRAEFTSTRVAEDSGVADFQGAHFARGTEVRFRQVNRRSAAGVRMRVVNCPIEDVQFEDVHWHRKGERMILQDELDIIEPSSEVWRRHDYELVAIAYRQLANNFEKSRNYDLAEDCIIGAMEMKRLDPAQPRFVRLIVSAYRWASNYGSNYQRALEGLLVLFCAFAVLFAVLGVEPRQDMGEGSHTVQPWEIRASRAYLAGWLHSIEVATFQREMRYKVRSDIGHLVEALEILFVSSQLSLLVLALRRRLRH